MKDALAHVGTIVDDEPECVVDAQLASDFARHEHEVAEQRLILSGRIRQPR